MQYSGYSKKCRTEVVKSALNAFNKMVEKDEAGEEPQNRPRVWNEAREPRENKGQWFK